MRVLHLGTSDTRGGAARGAYFLHQKLQEIGVDSLMLVGRQYSDSERVVQLDGALAPVTERIRGRLDQLPLRRYRKTSESFWTTGWQPRRLKSVIARLQPDIVHLQWTGGGFLPIEAIQDIEVPVVWTMRDMWPFTGGCHYTSGCTRYSAGCGQCPQLRSEDPDDISRSLARRKTSALQQSNLWLVPISGWLADCARKSRVLSDGLFPEERIKVIPNGIDTTRFRPIDKRVARQEMDLPENGRFILFSALNALSDERKGFGHLITALRQLRSATDPEPPELLIAGDVQPEKLPRLDVPVRFLGTIQDNDRLRTAYAAADLVVAPSLQEAFGKVHVEAMACGTPVVAYDSGGPGEIITHRETGYLATAFDESDLAAGMDWCLDPERDRGALSSAARHRAVVHYDIAVIAARYRALYENILRRSK
ncbi:MAG: glycosyltransferase family 4 protein [Alphaproteobacteria bacterium]|nr:glycosyltransferase family 4 protein [Alphaproteobacteria bacterium]